MHVHVFKILLDLIKQFALVDWLIIERLRDGGRLAFAGTVLVLYLVEDLCYSDLRKASIGKLL
jgi:hypothetical protein